MAIVAAAGTSTERDPVLADLYGGAHDPAQRGFTLQQVELGLSAAVDQWFDVRGVIAASIDSDGETIVELEEAYASTKQLPWGLQLDAGTFFTTFGVANGQHPHEWAWQTQPVMLTRVFGGDGMRGPGARLRCHVPGTPHVDVTAGVQNARGETMVSFFANEEVYAERPIGGRAFAGGDVRAPDDLVWTLRVGAELDCGEMSSISAGVSTALGPNPTGGDSHTLIHGADVAWHSPWGDVQAELVARAFDAAQQLDASDPLNPVVLPATTLDDVGGYVHALHTFSEQWSCGVRFEWATGDGDSYRGSGEFDRRADPFRADRVRVSPLVSWRASPASRIRLQYDFDDSDHLASDVHSVWLGFEVMLGGHADHEH